MTPPSITTYLIKVLTTFHGLLRTSQAFVLRITARDSMCLLILLVVAVLLRLPMLSTPSVSQFDEITYANFALFTNAEKPFFDIHPRLAHVLFAEIIRAQTPFTTHSFPTTTVVPFNDFPYTPLRTFVAWAGILLTFIIYGIGRVLGYAPRMALVPALFILFDGALTIYGRVILPDTLLLVCNFLGVLFALLAVKASRKFPSLTYTLIGGVMLGCALSIKWVAAAVVLSVVVMYFLYRKFAQGIIVGTIAVLTYVGIFVFILMHFFPHGGSVKNYQNVNYPPWVTEIHFPQNDSTSEAVQFLPQLHLAMFRANNDPLVLSQTLKAPSPLSWPISRSEIIFSTKENGKRNITMTGNSLLWVVSFFALLFNFFWIYFTWKRTRKFPIEKDELILIFGYLANYLPFFLIHRPMYLYHYFTALLFLFLLLPKITPRILHCLGEVTNDRLFAKTFIVAVALLVVLNFFLALPLTYGW